MTEGYTRSQRYRIVNEALWSVKHDPAIPPDTRRLLGPERMYASELDRFESACGDLPERLRLASYSGDPIPLADAVIAFRKDDA